MRKVVWWAIVAFGVALVAVILYRALPTQQREPDPAPSPLADRPAPPADTRGPPALRYPVPPAPLEKPLPALDTSDTTVGNELRSLWSDEAVEERFQLKDFIRRLVATIDNLPRAKIATRMVPVKRVEGPFLVQGKEEELAIGADNSARYVPYVRLLEAVDTGKLVSLYVRMYPLFQQAYEDLGYPRQHFNDRLVEVIDDLLAAPQPQEAIPLVRPKVFYLYADPDLEARSSGQKILMRMGSDNAARVKARLRAIRAELVKLGDRSPR